ATAITCPLRVDAVEKVASVPLARNNRIEETDILNRSYAFDSGFESMLLGDPPKILFQQYRLKADKPSHTKLRRCPRPKDIATRPRQVCFTPNRGHWVVGRSRQPNKIRQP